MRKIILLFGILLFYFQISVFGAGTYCAQIEGEYINAGAKIYYSPYSDCEPKMPIGEYMVVKNFMGGNSPDMRNSWVITCSPNLDANFNMNSYTFYINPLDMKVTNTGIHDFAVFRDQNIIIANEVEGEYGENGEEEVTWIDSPPIYFSGNEGIVCDATLTITDNGNIVAEIPVSQAQNFEYKADKLGVHYLETSVKINSCEPKFNYIGDTCPFWDMIVRRNDVCQPYYKDSILCWKGRVTNEPGEFVGRKYEAYFAHTDINDELFMSEWNKYFHANSLDTSQLSQNRLLNADAYIINVIEPTPEFNANNINAIILPSGEKPPEHLINLWEKI